MDFLKSSLSPWFLSWMPFVIICSSIAINWELTAGAALTPSHNDMDHAHLIHRRSLAVDLLQMLSGRLMMLLLGLVSAGSGRSQLLLLLTLCAPCLADNSSFTSQLYIEPITLSALSESYSQDLHSTHGHSDVNPSSSDIFTNSSVVVSGSSVVIESTSIGSKDLLASSSAVSFPSEFIHPSPTSIKSSPEITIKSADMDTITSTPILNTQSHFTSTSSFSTSIIQPDFSTLISQSHLTSESIFLSTVLIPPSDSSIEIFSTSDFSDIVSSVKTEPIHSQDDTTSLLPMHSDTGVESSYSVFTDDFTSPILYPATINYPYFNSVESDFLSENIKSTVNPYSYFHSSASTQSLLDFKTSFVEDLVFATSNSFQSDFRNSEIPPESEYLLSDETTIFPTQITQVNSPFYSSAVESEISASNIYITKDQSNIIIDQSVDIFSEIFTDFSVSGSYLSVVQSNEYSTSTLPSYDLSFSHDLDLTSSSISIVESESFSDSPFSSFYSFEAESSLLSHSISPSHDLDHSSIYNSVPIVDPESSTVFSIPSSYSHSYEDESSDLLSFSILPSHDLDLSSVYNSLPYDSSLVEQTPSLVSSVSSDVLFFDNSEIVSVSEFSQVYSDDSEFSYSSEIDRIDFSSVVFETSSDVFSDFEVKSESDLYPSVYPSSIDITNVYSSEMIASQFESDFPISDLDSSAYSVPFSSGVDFETTEIQSSFSSPLLSSIYPFSSEIASDSDVDSTQIYQSDIDASVSDAPIFSTPVLEDESLIFSESFSELSSLDFPPSLVISSTATVTTPSEIPITTSPPVETTTEPLVLLTTTSEPDEIEATTELILNISDAFADFWLKTVIGVSKDIDISSPDFISDMEFRLSILFNEAIERDDSIVQGTYFKSVTNRKKRAVTTGNATIQITSTSRSSLTPESTIVLYYLIENESGNITDASRTEYLLHLFTEQETAIALGYPIIIQGERYIPLPPPPEKKLWIIGAAIGGVVGVIAIVWCVLFTYFKCTQRTPAARRSPRKRKVDGSIDMKQGFDYVRSEVGRDSELYQMRPPDYFRRNVNGSSDFEGMYCENTPPPKYPSRPHPPGRPSHLPKQKPPNQPPPPKPHSSGDDSSDYSDKRPLKKSHKNVDKMEKGPENIRSSHHGIKLPPLDLQNCVTQDELIDSQRSRDQLNDSLRQRGDVERQRNKQRQRERRQKSDHTDSVAQNRAVTNPQAKPRKKKREEQHVPEDENGYAVPHNAINGSMTSQPSSSGGEESEASLENARQRMHALLDEAFALANPKQQRNKVVPLPPQSLQRPRRGMLKPNRMRRRKQKSRTHPSGTPVIEEEEEKEAKHTPIYMNKPPRRKEDYGPTLWKPYEVADGAARINTESLHEGIHPASSLVNAVPTALVHAVSNPGSLNSSFRESPRRENTDNRPRTNQELRAALRPDDYTSLRMNSSMLDSSTPTSAFRPYSTDEYDSLHSNHSLRDQLLASRSFDESLTRGVHNVAMPHRDSDDDEVEIINSATAPGVASEPLVQSIRQELHRLQHRTQTPGYRNSVHT